jgi:large subunit ribosomal protein L6
MSRIGKKPVVVPAGVNVTLAGADLTVKGPKGELAMVVADEVIVTHEGGQISVQPRNPTKRSRQFWGMQRTMVQNMVDGVSKGFQKNLEITGVGYRANAQGKVVKLQLGYSHDVEFPIPEGITVATPEPTKVNISGIDKQLVGEVAAKIREWRKPEPYKGKGIKYAGEFIFRKEGKKK